MALCKLYLFPSVLVLKLNMLAPDHFQFDQNIFLVPTTARSNIFGEQKGSKRDR